MGRHKTLVAPRFWSKVKVGSWRQCWPWTGAVRRKDEGYGAFWLDGRHQPANRVALVLSGVEVPEGMVACHRCDNPCCCNPNHLFVGLPKDNDADRVAKGRQSRGSRHGNAVLTEDLVVQMRTYAETHSMACTAQHFGIKYSTTWDAVRRRWRHV